LQQPAQMPKRAITTDMAPKRIPIPNAVFCTVALVSSSVMKSKVLLTIAEKMKIRMPGIYRDC
jgi:hypothetical protein